mmetsp:Transcript_30393/g.52681  ORF Transcript_30393/g.52681 Transcript_30393/m.52681 type:complete len:89 (-) Transcript_30393:471-737(-)
MQSSNKPHSKVQTTKIGNDSVRQCRYLEIDNDGRMWHNIGCTLCNDGIGEVDGCDMWCSIFYVCVDIGAFYLRVVIVVDDVDDGVLIV